MLCHYCTDTYAEDAHAGDAATDITTQALKFQTSPSSAPESARGAVDRPESTDATRLRRLPITAELREDPLGFCAVCWHVENTERKKE